MNDDLTMNGAIPSIRYQAIVQWVCGRLYRLIGLLLLSAALLKSHELSRGELSLSARTADAILPIALFYAESIVGVLLLLHVQPRRVRFGAAALFAGFIGWSLWSWSAGATSCGCFGEHSPSIPWILAMNSVAMCVLLIYRPPVDPRSPIPQMAVPLCMILAAMLCAGIQWWGMSGQLAFASLPTETIVRIDESLEGWRLSILTGYMEGFRAADIDRFHQGAWVVFVHSDHCSACRAAAQTLLQDRASLGIQVEQPLLWLRLPGGDRRGTAAEQEEAKQDVHRKLSDRVTWIATPPILLIVEEGVIVSVRTVLQKGE